MSLCINSLFKGILGKNSIVTQAFKTDTDPNQNVFKTLHFKVFFFISKKNKFVYRGRSFSRFTYEGCQKGNFLCIINTSSFFCGFQNFASRANFEINRKKTF